ncbi:hypothetical protein ZYGR_0AZ00670 [Zygosaccharomyces rouxii]|uniref:Peptide hydrolase n=1 Tax=Zygosaccharomyces rouxii TaxID=4956 RepID=A0A1Q3AJH8_ZYGRO|nr:hypothetical protein ZYGR_0AZ00670 [Zygosaccharomyces rouxii]
MFVDFLRSLFRLRKTNVSILLLLSYLTIGLIYFYDHEHYKHVTPEQSGFTDAPQLVEDAWLNLQNITHSYHPYFSRDNERVHDYLLDKIEKIARNSSFVSVTDDASDNRSVLLRNSFVDGGAVYFESSNIVVKLEGKNTNLPGLLLSAHYDGVPTSHGATDDGKGVVSLLGVLDHYSRHQPERTLVFNFNNNEEFGLLGAVAFMNHPWSKLVRYVINLEGTGIGGKAILFRTSDISTARIYQRAVKSNPFGNSIFQQGFYEGRVNSETDYRIYESNGLRGFDIAFYKPRDFYHTTRDSVQYTSREALWHMFYTAWQLTEYIAREPIDNEEDYTPAVFFDVAGLFFFTTSSKTLFKWCCVILVVLPVIAFHFDVISFSQNRSTYNQRHRWGLSIRLPLSFVTSLLLLKVTEKLLFSQNTFILSRGHLVPLIALATEFILSNYLILSFFEYVLPTRDFKTTALRQVAILNWIILFGCTIMLYKSEYKYTGIFGFVILYSFISLAGIIGLFGRVLRENVSRETKNNKGNSSRSYRSHEADEEQRGSETPAVDESARNLGNDDDDDNEGAIDVSTTNNSEHDVAEERAPLLGSNPPSVAGQPGVTETLKTKAVSVLNYDWSLQFLVAVPITTFIVFGCVDLSLDALKQTIQEGAAATAYVWNFVFLGGIMLTLPVLPFAYKFNYLTAMLFLIAFATTINLCFLQSPFTEWSPLKVKFSQEININNGTDAIVNVYGRKGGFLQPMLQDLPSVKQSGSDVWCQNEINGMERCLYAGYQPNPLDSQRPVSTSDFYSLKVISNDKNDPDRSPYAPINANLEINVKENRACTLWFKNQHLDRSLVRQLMIHHSDNTSESIKSNQGFTQLQLYKLDFDQQKYRVGVQWLPKILLTDGQGDEDNDELDLQVSCYWGEYDSESLVNGQHLRKLPAFDELLQYSPLNVSYANRDKGLLIITQSIEL